MSIAEKQQGREDRNFMQQLLRQLSEQNITLDINETGQLLVSAPAGVVTAELGALIRAHKTELVGMLQKSAAGRSEQALPRITPDPQSRHEPFPLNAVQHAYWIGRNPLMELGGVSTHFYFEVDNDDLDLARFEAALRKVIAAHDMLRATISNEGMQRVAGTVPAYDVRTLDLRSLPADAVADALAGVRAEMEQQLFDATRWPLFEVRAARLPQGRVRLFFSWDFLVVDAWSILLIFNQWRAWYDDPALAAQPTTLSFRDYILAERGLAQTSAYAAARRYWFERIDDLPAAPVLPVCKRIETGRTYRFTRRRLSLDAQAWRRLCAGAQQHAITPSNLMLAAFAEVLGRWSKSPRYALNLTLFNRLPLHEEVMSIVGDFTTLTVTEIGRETPATFVERAKAIQNRFLQDFEQRLFSGVEIMREIAKRRHSGGRALMPIVFTSTLMLARKDAAAAAQAGLEAFGRMHYGITQTPQVLLDCQIFEIDDELVVNWDAVDELFLPGVLDAMFGSMQQLVANLAGSPDAWLCEDLVPLPPAQQAVRAADHRSLQASRLSDDTLLLHEGFIRQALAQPDAIAIEGDATITYGELLSIACDLAEHLVEGGVLPNQLVAVVMEKGWQQIAAVLGILIAGGAYLPVDAALPPKRQNHLLRNGEATWVLAAAPVPDDVLDGTGARVHLVVRPSLFQQPRHAPPSRQKQSDIAYVIFTSGSSGEPKGVVIDHRGALTTILAMNDLFGVGRSDRVLAVASLSFDLSVYDIFGVLAAGGTVVVPPAAAIKDAAHWSRMIEQHRVTLWNSAPQLMSMLVEYNELQQRHSHRSIRMVWLSGDWIPTKLPAQIRALIGPCEIISLGGATEGSIWSIHQRIDGDTAHLDSIPYGKALPGQSMQVLDAALRPCPDHVIGQIYIGGPGVALGYWRDAHKTAQRFIVHPTSGERLYATGDLGRYFSDGTIEFLGREDEQVKLHGHRVELGEIAAQLKNYAHVEDAAAYIADEDGAPVLVACVVADGAENSPLFTAGAADADTQAARNARLSALPDVQPDDVQSADLIRFEAFWRSLSALSLDTMAVTLRTLGVSPRADIDAALSSAGVQQRFRPLIAAWLALLDDAAADRPSEERRHQIDEEELQVAITAFESEYGTDARTAAFCRYAASCLRRQAQLLRAETSPLELLFPQGDFSLATHIYGTNPICAHHNRQLAAALTQIAIDVPAGEGLRVLEVGAGTGANTAALVDLLGENASEYWFTDLSPLFLERAKQTFSQHAFVRYALFDVDVEPQAQGFALHDFDVIVAANVLHHAKHLPTALQRLRAMLKPGGHLLLLEGTRTSPLQWLTVGYLEGAGEYADERALTHSPILDAGQWRGALEGAGFEDVAAFPRATRSDEVGQALRNAMPQHVIVARGPARVSRFDPAALRAHLETILPAHMVPQRFVQMSSLPLTVNGKIDRAALPRLQRSTRARDRAVAPAHSNSEQAIHAIWKEVLGLDSIGVDDNFFDLGGDSLLLTQTLAKINRAFGLELAMADLFSYPTIRSLSEHLARASRSEAIATAVPQPARARAAGNDIAIVGMAGRFPDAPDVDTYWRNLCDGVCSVRDWDDATLRAAGISEALLADPRYVKSGVRIEGMDQFDAAYFGFTPREAQIMDPQQRFLLEAAVTAMEHAGYPHEKYAGEIGVFVGKDVSQYLYAHLMGRPALMQSVGVMGIANLNEKDYAATQISYNLGFTGPSLNINTACSTSLVAVHQACRSLLDDECSIALAGGVSLETLQPCGYLYRDGAVASPDGRCRAFSDDSNGGLRGSGIGLVVLKRLERALADRDTVHAVVKGSAINNDGALKIGFTAPSTQGQARVIAAALQRAGLAPAQIQYIEAHGTGTALGDPIEIKGLTQVFRRADGAQCLVGSVKSNFGHLDAAAGVAGLIKTALALRHGKIPPSLHFRAPNPRIDFGDGALRVVDRLCDWPAADGPRRAGVSSFGVGGTNAHVVLEQPPHEPEWRSVGATSHTFILSAANARSIGALAANLADWIEAHPAADPADVAYTLQVGRNAHTHRIAVVCADLDALRQALRQPPPPRVRERELTPTVVLVLAADPASPPQAATAHALYREQPVFRDNFDRCAELVRLYLDADIRSYFTAAPALFEPAIAAALSFALQYSLARLWLSFGTQTEAIVGRGTGEYAAACIAGVFSLEEALSLVAVGAQLRADTDDAQRASISDTFAACVRETRRGRIEFPFVSSVTGKWASDDEVAAPSHWVRHLGGTDNFSAALELLAREPRRCFLTIGAAIAPECFGHAAQFDPRRIAPMRDESRAALCAALADLWLNGIEIDWQATARESRAGRIPLPTYAFDRQSYWLPPVAADYAGYGVALTEGQASVPAEATARFPRPDLKIPYARPVGPAQCALVEIWQTLLAIEPVGADDNFFELGGDSVLGLQINEKMRSDLGIEIPADKLFQLGTVRNIANYHAVLRGEKTLEDLSDEEVDGIYRAYENR